MARSERRIGLYGLTPEAKQSLRQRGLLSGVWPERLAGAAQPLNRFINRFHRVSGFEYPVRDYFAMPYRRAIAELVMRLAERLAASDPDFARTMSFERAIGFAPGGFPVRTIEITRRGLRYTPYPGSRIDGLAIQKSLGRSVTLFQDPARIRWVFDGSRLGMGRGEVVNDVRRIVARAQSRPGAEHHDRRWLASLDRIVVVV